MELWAVRKNDCRVVDSGEEERVHPGGEAGEEQYSRRWKGWW